MDALAAPIALADLFQFPLIITLIVTIHLTRRWGRMWKAVAAAFGGLTLWVLISARFVGFTMSGYFVLTLGTYLDPFSHAWAKDEPSWRVWLCGMTGAVFVLWALPVFLAWLIRRRTPLPRTEPRTPGNPLLPLVFGVLLFAAQVFLWDYSKKLDQEGFEAGLNPIATGAYKPKGLALALSLPVVLLLVMALLRTVLLWRNRHESPK